jgi:hypothetical protein
MGQNKGEQRKFGKTEARQRKEKKRKRERTDENKL